MNLLPTTAAPGVAERAEALADAACELHDAAGSPAGWSAAAVEDAVEAMETTALALAAAHPDGPSLVAAAGPAVPRTGRTPRTGLSRSPAAVGQAHISPLRHLVLQRGDQDIDYQDGGIQQGCPAR